MPLDEVTQLLRRGDPSLVEADLVDLLVSGEEEWVKDDRDLMMALAPRRRPPRVGAQPPLWRHPRALALMALSQIIRVVE